MKLLVKFRNQGKKKDFSEVLAPGSNAENDLVVMFYVAILFFETDIVLIFYVIK